MLKFIARDEGDGSVILGFLLSEGNLKKLREGLPILVELSAMGVDGYDGDAIKKGKVIIAYGGTDDELFEMVKGKVSPDTIVHKQEKYHEG